MTLPVAALKAQYEAMSELFITEVNTNLVVLYFPVITGATSNTFNAVGPETSFDSYGGRIPISSFPDGLQEDGSQRHAVEPTGSFYGRTYWNTKKFDQHGNVINDDNTCKIITYSTNSDKIRECTKAVVNGYTIKLKQPPIPYGLFGKQYCISIWEIV